MAEVDFRTAAADLLRALLPESAAWLAAGLPVSHVFRLYPGDVAVWQDRLLAQLAAAAPESGDLIGFVRDAYTRWQPLVLKVTDAHIGLLKQQGFESIPYARVAEAVAVEDPAGLPVAVYKMFVVSIDVLAAWLAGKHPHGIPRVKPLLAGCVTFWEQTLGYSLSERL